MPKKITNCTVVVHRDIKDEGTGETRTVRVKPPIGKAFNYTDAEVKEVLAANPRGLRDPINEDADASRDEILAQATTADAGASTKPAAKGNARAAKPSTATPDAPAGAVIVDKTETKTNAKVDSDI